MAELRRIERKIFFIIVGLGLLLCGVTFIIDIFLPVEVAAPTPVMGTKVPIRHKIVDKTSNLTNLWTASNIFSPANTFGFTPDLTASKGVVFVMGLATHPTGNYRLLALDAADGTHLWQMPGYYSGIYATSSALYVGATTRITAYDLRTGNRIWTKRFLFPGTARNVSNLYVEDNLIFARLGGWSDEYILEADSGKKSPKSVEAYSTDYFWGDRVFNEETMFVQPRTPEREIRAVNRQTEQILWRTQAIANVVSNLAATGKTVYLLTEDGQLLGLAAQTGEIVATVQFDPSPFIVYDPDRQPGGYYVAVDRDEGLLYALLGDSAQLFAFKIVGYSPNE